MEKGPGAQVADVENSHFKARIDIYLIIKETLNACLVVFHIFHQCK